MDAFLATTKRPCLWVLFLFLMVSPERVFASNSDFSSEEQSIHEIYEQAFEFEEADDQKNALLNYYQVINETEATSNKTLLLIRANSLNKAAIILYVRGDFVRALDYFLESKRIHNKINNNAGVIELTNNIGTVYYAWNNYEQARNYYLAALNLLNEDENAHHKISLVKNNISLIYLDQKEYEKALDYLLSSFGSLSETRPEETFHHLLNIGTAYQKLGEFEKANDYYQKIIELGEKKNNSMYISAAYSCLGEMMLERGVLDSAVIFIRKSNEIAVANDNKNLLHGNYLMLSQIFEKTGDFNKSLSYQKKHQTVKEEVFNFEKHQQIQELLLLYETEKKDKEIISLRRKTELKNKEISIQKRISLILFVGFFLICILLILLFIQKKRKDASHRELVRKNLEIVKKEKEHSKLNQPDKNHPLIPKKALFGSNIHNIEKRGYNLPFTEKNISQLGALIPDVYSLKNSCLSDQSSLIQQFNNLTHDNKKPTSYIKIPEGLRDNLLTKIINVMEGSREFLEADFTIDKLAKLVGSNKRYVSQIINEEFNQTYNHFINYYRIKEARRLLSDDQYENITIEAIANMVGFKSKSSFNLFFKKFTGITPSFYQKSLNNKVKI